VNKTLSKKFIYVITVLAILAMMVPAMAIPVSAAPTLSMTIYGDTDGAFANGKWEARNIGGSLVEVTASTAPISWGLSPQPGSVGIAFEPTPAPTDLVVYVRGTLGEAQIIANFAENYSVSVTKKWGDIDHSVLTGPGSQDLMFQKSSESWYAGDLVTDTVYGKFVDNPNGTNPMQGVILNWYLILGNTQFDPVMMNGSQEAQDLNEYFAGLDRAQYTEFVDTATFDQWDHTSTGWLGTGADPNGLDAANKIQTITDVDGKSSVNIGAWFKEQVKVVVVEEYPNSPNKSITPEVTTYNYFAPELPAVPQVRWEGEKIVLEANFGEGVTGEAEFFLNNGSVGTLEGLDDDSEHSSVWTDVDDNGTAICILTSLIPGEANVSAALYPHGRNAEMTNQFAFRVYFLSFESLTLSDVDGKRAAHNDGLWTPANPYNEDFPALDTADMLEQTLNVSQDALERVQVRGWFQRPYGTPGSGRMELPIDYDNDGTDDMTLPEGRFVLPDDWKKLSGNRMTWDIMCAPDGSVTESDVNRVGPFTPGQETMYLDGWSTSNTVVPDGVIDPWDAPMPPAKIILSIVNGPGFFKEALKSDIYYLEEGGYTNPFYKILVPASPLIAPFNAQGGGGYSWDSYDEVKGPYEFWEIFAKNTLRNGLPDQVEVYSDNHGEAMVWLNGDNALDLSDYTGKGGADIPLDRTVGITTVQACADYPYVRMDNPICSNEVVKTWFWSGQILGTDSHDFGTTGGEAGGEYLGSTDGSYTKMVLSAGNWVKDDNVTAVWPDEFGFSNDKVVWIWACDRDGLIDGVLGTTVQWRVTGGAYIPFVYATQISGYNDITEHIALNNGLVSPKIDTVVGNVFEPDRVRAVSTLREPTTYEKQLFHKKWPLLYADATGEDPINFAVAAIDIYSDADVDCTVETILTGPDFGFPGQPNGNVYYGTNIDFAQSFPMDDPIVAGDANADGVVDAADITKVERIIMGLDAPNVNADTNMNGSIDMGDVVKISRIIRGLE